MSDLPRPRGRALRLADDVPPDRRAGLHAGVGGPRRRRPARDHAGGQRQGQAAAAHLPRRAGAVQPQRQGRARTPRPVQAVATLGEPDRPAVFRAKYGLEYRVFMLVERLVAKGNRDRVLVRIRPPSRSAAGRGQVRARRHPGAVPRPAEARELDEALDAVAVRPVGLEQLGQAVVVDLLRRSAPSRRSWRCGSRRSSPRRRRRAPGTAPRRWSTPRCRAATAAGGRPRRRAARRCARATARPARPGPRRGSGPGRRASAATPTTGSSGPSRRDGCTHSPRSAPGAGRPLAVAVDELPEAAERLLAGDLLLDDRGHQRLHHQAGAARPASAAGGGARRRAPGGVGAKPVGSSSAPSIAGTLSSAQSAPGAPGVGVHLAVARAGRAAAGSPGPRACGCRARCVPSGVDAERRVAARPCAGSTASCRTGARPAGPPHALPPATSRAHGARAAYVGAARTQWRRAARRPRRRLRRRRRPPGPARPRSPRSPTLLARGRRPTRSRSRRPTSPARCASAAPGWAGAA